MVVVGVVRPVVVVSCGERSSSSSSGCGGAVTYSKGSFSSSAVGRNVSMSISRSALTSSSSKSLARYVLGARGFFPRLPWRTDIFSRRSTKSCSCVTSESIIRSASRP